MQAAPRPRMKIAAPLLRGSGELHVVGRQEILTFADPDGAIHRLVELADGSRSTNELVSALVADYPQLGEQDVVDAVSALESAGLLESAARYEDSALGRGSYADRRRGELAAPLY